MVERLIAISGMPGSGKSIVSDVARGMGYQVYSMGDIIRNEAKRIGTEPSPSNLGMIALEFRKTRGPAIVARMLIERIEEDDVETVIVEGVRSIEEVKEFRKHFKVKVLAVVSSPEVRFSRLKGRSRTDDPRDIVEFNERDQRELTFGIAKVMDTADTRILNEYDVGSFRRQIRDVLEELTRVG